MPRPRAGGEDAWVDVTASRPLQVQRHAFCRAVLVAEQLFASGCRLLISITSAGQLQPVRRPPYFVLIDRALRDSDAVVVLWSNAALASL